MNRGPVTYERVSLKAVWGGNVAKLAGRHRAPGLDDVLRLLRRPDARGHGLVVLGDQRA